VIPWEEFEDEYAQQFLGIGIGAPAKSFRIALGSEIIKRKLDITDEEVSQIQENPYLQYFIGMEGYRNEAPFEASMMVHFRRRLGLGMVNWVNDEVIERKEKEGKEEGTKGILNEGGRRREKEQEFPL